MPDSEVIKSLFWHPASSINLFIGFRMNRLPWIDNLRALMIILVVMVHAGVTYSGIGSWYYVENKNIGLGSSIFFAFFQGFNQAYFMSLLFMIAGYFTQRSLTTKSTGKFVSSRLSRLGIPLIIYIFFIHPLYVKLIKPNLDLIKFYQTGIINLSFLSWTGPTWFLEALLIFSLIYTALFKTTLYSKINIPFGLKTINVIILILFITIFAFFTRLFLPIGSDVMNLQLEYFPAYIVMFTFGIFAYNHNIFEQIDHRAGKKWILTSIVVGIPLWMLVIFFSGATKGEMLIFGGLNWPAFFYALWESFFCLTFILGIAGIFRERFNEQNTIQKFITDNAFGVFVFHAPVLITVSLLLKSIILSPVIKFFMISTVVIPLTFILSWPIRRIKPFRKIFS